MGPTQQEEGGGQKSGQAIRTTLLSTYTTMKLKWSEKAKPLSLVFTAKTCSQQSKGLTTKCSVHHIHTVNVLPADDSVGSLGMGFPTCY